MYKRLVKSGWFANEKRIDGLQKLASGLRAARALPSATPLSQVEFIVLDLEATNGSSGVYKLNKGTGKGRFLAGWDEIFQFGYAVVRNGAVLGRGVIDLRPTLPIDRVVERITGVKNADLNQALPLEERAEEILELISGRVIVGHGALRKDWPWLQSNFARLGVHLPGPRQMTVDTQLLSFNVEATGMSLERLAERLQVNFGGKHHNAGADADVTASCLLRLIEASAANTLGELLAYQARGEAVMHRPRVGALEPDRAVLSSVDGNLAKTGGADRLLWQLPVGGL
jgi:DNA polymerase III epsilon subunit-like protein